MHGFYFTQPQGRICVDEARIEMFSGNVNFLRAWGKHNVGSHAGDLSVLEEKGSIGHVRSRNGMNRPADQRNWMVLFFAGIGSDAYNEQWTINNEQ